MIGVPCRTASAAITVLLSLALAACSQSPDAPGDDSTAPSPASATPSVAASSSPEPQAATSIESATTVARASREERRTVVMFSMPITTCSPCHIPLPHPAATSRATDRRPGRATLGPPVGHPVRTPTSGRRER